ncbi:pyruvate dehydrogenase (acetyl-transferring), homodimeric type [Euryarchaeota archaeon]|uniref:Pyruvate dehydrogenase E1 component n=1 Tax=uncultured Poseidoniia archaeon TaxID=1697135 RepID=A0A1B1T9U3_9ARCH|nr:pyruvate dehydrogenase subunit E1 (aceE) [uncultured Candidatus Thalassoarchaea sp.]MAS18386.1 pyruvate dehydrogenase (acetyl-transferring), homodimeric type [Euryarchaeota archaeon]MDC0047399.1 pyruvate dehydrogenase (acetyl-transferring), homodimeric type [Euryarchaeota archaeon]MDC0556086.1 pyruvate dehydrogenase (acetyl-transferring), homodimeric type [Euryarchaeota archaeon]RCH74104.1 MAG: pyruvate dehydrogenase (acetyl-transferring), homodimeric type [Candidatus Poseidoniales archaeon]|tara:strand:- start:8683 stop:11340 length:2658 start_codon:yes stop_codon:yes gene_type:complete
MSGNNHHQRLPDIDPEETDEWLESLRSVVDSSGLERARLLLHEILTEAQDLGVEISPASQTPYVNTIPWDNQTPYPGNLEIEKEIQNAILWNSALIVSDANRRTDGIGGHISTYASSSTIYEVGFNHVFKGKESNGIGDALYIQGHGSPGIYARAFLEGRITREQLLNFRQEAFLDGLSSYPHPRLMKEFWEYPTVSMGLGPLAAVMQARFWKYLTNRNLVDTSQSTVYSFLGDGEMDEPEAIAAIAVAGREKLDNLITVVNCNLQRLDGPVRGNSKIIQELEGLYRGAGWDVFKVLWDSNWDRLFSQDSNGVLLSRLEEINDGDFQRMSTLSPSDFRKELFSGSEELVSLGSKLSDQDIIGLRRGGHDPLKIYAAYHAALESDKPAVILAHTVKGWGIDSFAGRNTTHQKKKMNIDDLIAYRDRLNIPLDDEQLQSSPFYSLDEESEALEYIHSTRGKLGGYLPSRKSPEIDFNLPSEETYSQFDNGTPEGQKVSTTMAFVRLLRNLMKSEIGDKVVPIIPDEGRTFGMDPLFSEFGIYSHSGQKYKPVDHKMIMKYKESITGQILEEGISEANSIASWIASATSYSHAMTPTLPFYIFYSMFGFQRVNDQIWQAADARARGFLMGATAGRTTLNGEGLQHQDGHSLLHASTVPFCRSWDPAYAYELATIIRHGINEMWGENQDVFHYIMLYNQNERQPPKPEGIDDKIIKGAYRLSESKSDNRPNVRILGSGPILSHVIEASEKLVELGINSEIWSVTSYGELRREGLESQRINRLYPEEEKIPYVSECFGDEITTVAVSDYITAVPEMIQRWVGGKFIVLGTDGFGRSDDRLELRRFFEIDTNSIVLATISALEREGSVKKGLTEEIVEKWGISRERFDKTH